MSSSAASARARGASRSARRATRSACSCRRTTGAATRCASPACRSASICASTASTPTRRSAGDTGSIIIVVATDAPLLPHQLKRLAKRAALGLARNGSYAGNGSGDLFVAFSTANAEAVRDQTLNTAQFVGNDAIDPLFLGTVEATEEAIVNALVAGRDMHGQNGRYAIAIPHEALRALLRRYNRLVSR